MRPLHLDETNGERRQDGGPPKHWIKQVLKVSTGRAPILYQHGCGILLKRLSYD
jgi:hypothetical protein